MERKVVKKNQTCNSQWFWGGILWNCPRHLKP